MPKMNRRCPIDDCDGGHCSVCLTHLPYAPSFSFWVCERCELEAESDGQEDQDERPRV